MKHPSTSDVIKIVLFLAGLAVGSFVYYHVQRGLDVERIAKVEASAVATKEDMTTIKSQIMVVQQNQVATHTDLTAQIQALREDNRKIFDYLLNRASKVNYVQKAE